MTAAAVAIVTKYVRYYIQKPSQHFQTEAKDHHQNLQPTHHPHSLCRPSHHKSDHLLASKREPLVLPERKEGVEGGTEHAEHFKEYRQDELIANTLELAEILGGDINLELNFNSTKYIIY